jgi:Septum formation
VRPAHAAPGAYRGGVAPPPPGASHDLPPGYLTDEGKARRRRSERRQRRLMMALGVLIVVGAVAATAVITAASKDDQTLADIELGVCFNGGPNDVDPVECTEPHEYELFAVTGDADATAEYPGQEKATTDGGTACAEALTAYYGAPPETALANGLEVAPIAPTEKQWNDGETQTYCLAVDAQGRPLESTIQGAGAAG